ncbi:MAG: 4-hydroxy-tetrahydrodipicolinate reductase [Cephaloticoccus sp.]|nr:4-hydroxy-tetrahydrodipicolinate reductase [Cephaloticoccus sp.]MCF7760784.1 4-hydroxy-tetrahydrodipicolinate reductase [Cephaloticoccus sp.]
MALSISLVGSRGRMGQTIASLAPKLDITVAAAVDMGDDLSAGVAKGDVIVDFSFHAVTAEVIRHAVALQKPLIIGTTGHSIEQRAKLLLEAAKVPCVWAGNYSVGVNVLNALTQQAAQVLTDDYDAEVIEMHHRYKKDAPSGTAARLLEIILQARKLGPEALRHGREGIPGERTRSEVGIHSLRGGDVVGDHTVMFAAPGERIELTHKASDRGIFARGALRAACWVHGKAPGVYDMQDVLGLGQA